MKSGKDVIGGYRLDAKLAIGGSGTVYRATRLSNGQAVAFKLMHAELEEQDAERKRFTREAKIVRTLVHPHIVRLLDYGHSQRNVPFLVFPLLDGQTLHDHLREHGAFSVRETGRLSLQILSALERAHRLDIAHRDIKPANIFLVNEGEHLGIKVLDFGLAKLLCGEQRVDITRVGALIGTPRYMAPEQVRAETIGMAADIYSFALVMAEMLLGRPVVDAEGELEVYMAHGSDHPLDIPDAVMGSPFASVIRRALAKPLEVRYQKASQMHADLQAVMALLERSGEGASLASADLETTQVIQSNELDALRQRHHSKASKKLRDAFNRLADRATDEKIARHLVPQAPPTMPMRVADEPPPSRPLAPAPAESLPILLTRRHLDRGPVIDEPDEDTLRIQRFKKEE